MRQKYFAAACHVKLVGGGGAEANHVHGAHHEAGGATVFGTVTVPNSSRIGS